MTFANLTASELILIPDDQIDYGTLSVEVLAQLAVQRDEPFIATSALGELGQRGVERAFIAACEQILDAPIWDAHLSAFALTSLYQADAARALPRMAKLVRGCEDPRLLAAMIDNVLSDLERFQTAEVAFSDELARQTARVDAAQFSDPDARAAFLELFVDRAQRS